MVQCLVYFSSKSKWISTIVGDGRQMRDFTLSDVVDAFILAGKTKTKQKYLILELANLFQLILLLQLAKKVYIPKRPGEPDKLMQISLQQKNFKIFS